MTAALRPEVGSGGLLRVITAGSVDDGKSTLIGRLLFDSKAILADQIASLRSARHKRSVIDESDIDLALLTDGLEAEREQGITIDVAYRYFSTASRKFILADAPGHAQYTRNMVTGASNSDAAVILIDASRVREDQLLEQTHRHLVIASLIGVHYLIVAVNKMDLVDYEQHRFQTICGAVKRFAEKLGRSDVHFVPVSALRGCNVVRASSTMPWYTGPALLKLLESLPPAGALAGSATSLRLPVQIVLRANGASSAPYRAFAGRVEAGSIATGDSIVVLPAGRSARVQRIWQFDKQLPRVTQGAPCAIELDRDIDVSRGDLIVRQGDTMGITRQLEADVCWLDSEPLAARKKFYFRHGSCEVQAKVSEILYRSDIRSLERQPSEDGLEMNDIARVRISLAHPVAVDTFDSLRSTGRFILIDAASCQTSAAGLVRGLTA
jgi:sulfate adenylyltransferase subunit 1